MSTEIHALASIITKAWQKEGELKSAAEVCHRRFFLALSTECEVTRNLGDFWVGIFNVANSLRCVVGILLSDGCCEIYHGDARWPLVCDANLLGWVPEQSSELRCAGVSSPEEAPMLPAPPLLSQTLPHSSDGASPELPLIHISGNVRFTR